MNIVDGIKGNKCIRISDGQFWVTIAPNQEYQGFITRQLLKTGDLIKVLETSGSPRQNNFKLVGLLL